MNDLENRVKLLEKQLSILMKSDRYEFQKNIALQDGRNIQLALGTGTKIGTAATQKLGFWGASPVIQANAISNPSGGSTIDSQARTAITSINTVIHNAGLTA